MTSELLALKDIISSSIDAIVSSCVTAGQDFPSLNDPAQLSEFAPDGVRNRPDVVPHIALIVAAASQLMKTVQAPAVTLATDAFKYMLPVSLGIAEAANVAEIVVPAGPKGMHVDEIAARSGVDARKLARILRYLATNHWFCETAPDVFAVNLLASLLNTGKDVSTENFAATKHRGTPGLAAMVGFAADECLKGATYLPAALLDPSTTHSEELCDAAYARGLDFPPGTTVWDHYDSPEGSVGAQRKERFAVAMGGLNAVQPPESILSSFDWDALPPSSLVVDVGGGYGHVSLEIARLYQDRLRYAVEDRPTVIEQAHANWEKHLPDLVASGNASFIGLDILEPQPDSLPLPTPPTSTQDTDVVAAVNSPQTVFLLRAIMHDWPDKYAIQILRHLRDKAKEGDVLVIIDCVVDYACKASAPAVSENKVNEDGGVNGIAKEDEEANAEEKETKATMSPSAVPPKPLLANMGGANLIAYTVDLLVLTAMNSSERTLDAFKRIISAGGWRLREVRKNTRSEMWWPSLICEPA